VQTDWLLFTPGHRADARVLGVILSPDRGRTTAVKLARTPASAERMERGATVLARLHETASTRRRFAPLPSGRVRGDDGPSVATMEEFIDGRPLDALLRRHSLPRATEEITDWLIALALATRGAHGTCLWESMVHPLAERFRAACGHAVDAALLDSVSSLLASSPPLPTVLAHHDFRPWNLYVTRQRRLVALDWDNARWDGLPALDLLHAHAFLAFAVDGTMRTHRFGAAQRRAEAGALGTVREACVRRYAAAVGVDDDGLRAVRAIAWMPHCIEAASARAAAGRPLRRVDVPTTILSLWEFEARRALA
jgi:aminoglycoside phosphotransferase (APT) family kinase protein